MSVRFDTFAAALILFGAMFVTVLAFRKLIEVEHPKHTALQVLPLGTHKHFVLQGGKCVGKFETEFKNKPETTIISKGELRFSYQGRLITATSFVGSFFNVLDQLVACNINVEIENGKVAIKTLNPSPIAVTAELSFETQKIEHQLELPGPILLRSNGNDTYRIDYSAWTGMWSSYNPMLVENALGGLDLKMSARDNEPEICRSASGDDVLDGAIELDSLVAQAQALFLRMRQTPFFPPGG